MVLPEAQDILILYVIVKLIGIFPLKELLAVKCSSYKPKKKEILIPPEHRILYCFRVFRKKYIIDAGDVFTGWRGGRGGVEMDPYFKFLFFFWYFEIIVRLL